MHCPGTCTATSWPTWGTQAGRATAAPVHAGLTALAGQAAADPPSSMIPAAHSCAASSARKERTERHPRERHQELPMHTKSFAGTKRAAAIRGDKDATFGVVLARDCREWVSLQPWTAASQSSGAVDLDAVARNARVVPCGRHVMQDPIAVLKGRRPCRHFQRVSVHRTARVVRTPE